MLFKYIASALVAAAVSAETLMTVSDVQITDNSLSGVASFTWYASYAKCCPDNPNYDPKASKTEC